MKLAAFLASLAVVTSSLVVASGPAADAGSSCTKHTVGKHRFEMGRKSFHWTIRQHEAEENYSGRTAKLTFTAGSGRSTTESVNVNAEVSARFKAGIFGEMEARVGTDLGRVGEKTSYSSVTKEYWLRTGDVYHFVRGSGYYRARATVYRCSWVGISRENTYWKIAGDGPVKGYLPRTATVVGCEQRTDRGTLGRYVQKKFCR